MLILIQIFTLTFSITLWAQTLTKEDAAKVARGEWVMQQLSINEYIPEASPKNKNLKQEKHSIVIFQKMSTGQVIHRSFSDCDDLYSQLRHSFKKEKIGHPIYPLLVGYQEYRTSKGVLLDYGVANCKSFLKKLKTYQNEDSVSFVSEVLSIVGPWVSLSTKLYEQKYKKTPQKIESWYTYDLRNSKTLSLDKLVVTKSLIEAVNKSSLKKKKGNIKTLLQLKAQFGSEILKSFSLASYNRKSNLLEVRVATESSHVKYKDQKMPYITLQVTPTPRAVKFLNDALVGKGFFMSKRPLIKRHQ